MSIYCIHHSPCADGLAAAWVIKTKYPNVILVPLDYNNVDFFNLEQFKDSEVYFVDCSLKRHKIIELAKIASQITIIDHHKTAYINLVNLPSNVKTVFDMNNSGAVLTWKFFNPEFNEHYFLKYIEDRDLWLCQLDFNKEFGAWYDSENPQSVDELDKIISKFNYNRHDCFRKGEIIIKYRQQLINDVMKHANHILLLGEDFIKVNCSLPQINSELGNQLVEKYNVPTWIWYETINEQGQTITVNSLRSKDGLIDVSKIAENFGGGGHKNSAAFRITVL